MNEEQIALAIVILFFLTVLASFAALVFAGLSIKMHKQNHQIWKVHLKDQHGVDINEQLRH